MKTPYPHQMKNYHDLRSELRSGKVAPIVVAATGYGKTVFASYLIRQGVIKGTRAIFCVHRKNLINQTALSFSDDCIDFGYIQSGKSYDSEKLVHIASMQTLIKKMESVEIPKLLICDEIHLGMGSSYSKIIEYFKSKGVIVIGLTATPQRLDGKPLGDLFDTIVEGPSVKWMIENGFLSTFKYYAPTIPDVSNIKKVAGDYASGELEKEMSKSKLVGDVVSHYKKLAMGKMTVCFCVNINHSKLISQSFCDAGIPSAHVDGNTPEDEQKAIFKRIASGEVKVLCNAQLLSEGWDLSAQTGTDATIECVIMLRPTTSLVIYLQQVGRGLRRKPYPAILIDHAANVLKFGMPDDDREWSLDGKESNGNGSSENTIDCPVICENCFQAVVKPVPDLCPHCGAEMKKQKAVIKIIEGELQEIKEAERLLLKEKLKHEEREAKTLNDFVALAQKRGYKNPVHWAKQKTEGRASRQARFKR